MNEITHLLNWPQALILIRREDTTVFRRTCVRHCLGENVVAGKKDATYDMSELTQTRDMSLPTLLVDTEEATVVQESTNWTCELEMSGNPKKEQR